MSTLTGYVTWRVRAERVVDDAATFDCTLIFHTIQDPHDLAPGETLRVPFRRYYNRTAPFEETLADEPFTLVLRAHEAPLVVDFESSICRGSVSANAEHYGSPAIIVHTMSGASFSGLPEGPRADHAFDWHALMDENSAP